MADLLILTPLRSEERILRRFFSGGFSIHSCGLGPHHARERTEKLFDEFRPEGCVLMGFCAAARSDLSSGEAVLLDQIRCEEIAVEERTEDPRPTRNFLKRSIEELLSEAERPKEVFPRGAGLTIGRLVADPEEKYGLGEEYSVDVIDMESGVVLQIAEKKGIPCVAIRVVLDEAELDISGFFPLFVRDREPSARQFSAYLLRHPRLIVPAFRLLRSYRRAAVGLARAVRMLEEILPSSL